MPRITAPPEDLKDPDWGAFQLAMMMNAGYQKISHATSSQVERSRFETYCATHVENWPVAAQLWKLMIGGLSEMSQPTKEDIAAWNAIVQQTNMPITFDENGLLKPTEEAT